MKRSALLLLLLLAPVLSADSHHVEIDATANFGDWKRLNTC
jgi:hypothetical protein